jgi:hypothetical protein
VNAMNGAKAISHGFGDRSEPVLESTVGDALQNAARAWGSRRWHRHAGPASPARCGVIEEFLRGNPPAESWTSRRVTSECEKDRTSAAPHRPTFKPKSKTSVQPGMRATTAALKSDGD